MRENRQETSRGEKFAAGLKKGLAIAWQNIPFLEGGWASWANVPDNVATYNALIEGDAAQGFFICGDQTSQYPGWQEGAVQSAVSVTALTAKALNYFAPVATQVPDSRAITEGGFYDEGE